MFLGEVVIPSVCLLGGDGSFVELRREFRLWLLVIEDCFPAVVRVEVNWHPDRPDLEQPRQGGDPSCTHFTFAFLGKVRIRQRSHVEQGRHTCTERKTPRFALDMLLLSAPAKQGNGSNVLSRYFSSKSRYHNAYVEKVNCLR